MTRKLICPLCRSGKMEDFTCTVCGFVDMKTKKMYEAMKKHE